MSEGLAAPGSEPAADAGRRVEALALLTAWVQRTGLGVESQPHGLTAVLPAAAAVGRPEIQLRFGLAPSDQPGVYFAATTGQRIARSEWVPALALCSDWNSRVLAPRARLGVTEWSSQSDAPLVLEAFLPLVPELPLAAVAYTGTQLVRAALTFWTEAPARSI